MKLGIKLRRVLRFFKPDGRKLALLGACILIGVGGWIQSWGFSDGLAGPKPPFYDFLLAFPLWTIWVYLLTPVALLNLPLRMFGIDLLGTQGWAFTAVNLGDFYWMSCVLVTLFDWLRGARRPTNRSANPKFRATG
jgi:hypothetical protein